MKRSISMLGLAMLLVALVVPFDARAASQIDVAGETEAFVLRAEYDIPLPASIGTEPHVIGEIRKTFGENAKGLSGAPTNFTAVTGGDVYDPWAGVNGNDGPLKVSSVQTPIGPPVDPHNPGIPTAECFYPGDASKTISWPRDIRPETKPLPPLTYANAECGPGPATNLTAWSAAIDPPGSPFVATGALVHSGPLSADSQLSPEHGVVKTAARATGHALSFLDGVIRIGDVDVEGHSEAPGPGGKAATTGHVSVQNVEAGGQKFSIADDSLVIGGNEVPIDSSAGRAFLDNVNNALDPTGCKLTVMSPASPYPQGFLLSRKPPRLGLADDGTFAASMHGAMLVLCDVPTSITEPTTFTPQRVQFLIGFEYTMATATKDDAGFGFGDLAVGANTITTPSQTIDEPAPATTTAPVVKSAPTEPLDQPQAIKRTGRTIRYAPLGTTTRIAFILIGLVLLLVATNYAIRRVRQLVGS